MNPPTNVGGVAAAAPAVPTSAWARYRTFKSLAHRDYRLLWFGVCGASTGQWMEQVVIGWLGYELTGSALALGLVNAFRAVPALLSGPLGGVAADRMDRKQLMVLSQLILGGAVALLLALTLAGHLQMWHLYLFAVVSGIGWSFNQPVRQSMVPTLVPREDLTNAIALQSSAFQLSRLVGPSIAGVLLAAWGAGSVMMLELALFAIVIATSLQMNVPPRAAGRAKEHPLASLKAGFAYIRNYHELFSVMLMALIPQLFAIPYFTIMPVFAAEVLHTNAVGYGVLATMPGVGATVATLTVATLSDIRNRGKFLVVSAVVQGVSIVILAGTSLASKEPFFADWLSPAFVLSALVLVFVGGSVMTYNTLSNTLVQTLSSDEMRGRVASVYMFNQGLQPLGTTWAGFLASLPMFGAAGAYLIMGLTTVAMAAGLNLKFPTVRRL